MIQLYSNSFLTKFSGALLLCLLSINAFAQNTVDDNPFDGDVTIETRQDLVDFMNGVDKYTSIDGDLLIEPSEDLLGGLDALSDIISITGNLDITDYGNNSVSQSVGNPLFSLMSLSETGSFTISSSPGITALSSVSLLLVDGNFEINDLLNLNLLSLTNLMTVDRSFTIENVGTLLSFSTPALRTIGRNIEIVSNPNLGTLSGFSGVTSVGNNIVIRGNESLDGVRSLGGNSGARLDVNTLTVVGNPQLQNFGTASNDFRVRVKNAINIENNIELTVLGSNIEPGIAGVDVVLSNITIASNPKLASISPTFNKGHRIDVGSYNLTDNAILTGPFGSQAIRVTGSLSISNNSAIVTLPNFSSSNNATIRPTGDVTIFGNTSLTSLEEFNMIDTIGGNLQITNNDNLVGLGIFNNLRQVNSITIQNNDKLTSLNDFTAASLNVTINFTIIDNALLSDCCAPVCKTTVDGATFDGTNPAVAIFANSGACADKPALISSDCSTRPGKACLIAAPVEFVYFTGALRGNTVELDWGTATETDNDYFQVERSSNGSEFVAIGRVTGAGESQADLTYRFDDNDYVSGVNYYRLRQVDYDGTEDFSNVIAIDAGQGDLALGMFPNPTNGGEVNFRLSSDWNSESTVIEVFSVSGQLMLSVNDSRKAIPTDRLTSGIYAVRVSDGSRSVTERLIVR